MRDFLEWLWHDSDQYYGEVRVLGDGKYATQDFYELPDGLDSLLQHAREDDEAGLEVYVGVLPRLRAGGKAADVTVYTDILWADVDAKSHGGSKSEALDAILDFPIPPCVIVDSGHGFHCYWRLANRRSFSDAQHAMKGIARRIGGDAVYDRARILRLPGLSNHKDGGNAPVRLIRFDTTAAYELSDFDEFRYVPSLAPASWQRVFDIHLDTDKGTLIDLDFDPGKPNRSEHDFGVVCWMLEHGWTDSEIEGAFIGHPEGIGAKTAKRGLGYLKLTIENARKVVR